MKSVQTIRVVSSNFSRSLYRLQLKFEESEMKRQFYVRVLTNTSMRTHRNEYDTLTAIT